MVAAMKRSSWYPTRTPSRIRSKDCAPTPSLSMATVAKPCSTVRSPVTCMTGDPYSRVPSWSKVAKEVPAYAAS